MKNNYLPISICVILSTLVFYIVSLFLPFTPGSENYWLVLIAGVPAGAVYAFFASKFKADPILTKWNGDADWLGNVIAGGIIGLTGAAILGITLALLGAY